MEKLALLVPYKGAVVLTALALILLLDRLIPAVRVAGGFIRVAKNLSFAAVNAVLSWAIVVPVTALAAGYALDWRTLWWGGWSGMLLDLLILDCWIYWWHRANHELPFLWRFHEIHHLDEFLDASSALRFHFGEVLLSSLVRALVIFLMGVPLLTVVVFETLLALLTMFHHSNIRIAPKLERALASVIVTPSIHWVHHHAIRRDTDSNYATLLSLWDRLFRSKSLTQRTPEMPIGVEGGKDRRFVPLLKRPFENLPR